MAGGLDDGRASACPRGDDMGLSYERLFQVSSGLLATADARGYFHDLSSAWEQTLGWSLDELRAGPYIKLIHPDDREATLAEAAALFQGRADGRFDNRYVCKDGSYRWLGWTARVDMDEAPSERLMVATALDLTSDRERTEQLHAGGGADHGLREAVPGVRGPARDPGRRGALPPRQPGLGAHPRLVPLGR